MKFDQQKYDNGEYAPDSFYGRLGGLEKIIVRVMPSFHDGEYSETEYSEFPHKTKEGLSKWIGEWKATKEIIAGVEARRNVLELEHNATHSFKTDNEECEYYHKRLYKIEELTKLLEGFPSTLFPQKKGGEELTRQLEGEKR